MGEDERLADQCKLAIWLATRPEKPTPMRALLLSSVSRFAVARALPELHPLSVETILIRSGLATGVLSVPGAHAHGRQRAELDQATTGA